MRGSLLQLRAYQRLESLPSVDGRSVLSSARIERYQVPLSPRVRYFYGFKPVTDEVLHVLQELCEEAKVLPRYHALLEGADVNLTEKRQVLHQLLRGEVLPLTGANKQSREYFLQELERVKSFCDQVRREEIRGSTGKPLQTFVQIGIGGSALGPEAICLALKDFVKAEDQERVLPAYFVSNIDPSEMMNVLEVLDPESTLFILVTKSGTTQETMSNANLVHQWYDRWRKGSNAYKHMVLVTSRESPAAGDERYLRSFYMEDSIGGRYSVSSVVGAVILGLSLGFSTFQEFLEGAHSADKSANNPNILENAALLDAVLGVYERNILKIPTTAILPYSSALRRFPAHLQQLDMESNGKSVNIYGEVLSYATGPIIWGEPGTNGQHSFYQLLHQGTDLVSLQFIGVQETAAVANLFGVDSNQRKLLANLTAQILAFSLGKESQNPFKQFQGNRPVSLLLVEDRLTPYHMGTLLAHYENKVMFQGFLWNINSFDQEGVQLGKVLAEKLLSFSSKSLDDDKETQLLRSLWDIVRNKKSV